MMSTHEKEELQKLQALVRSYAVRDVPTEGCHATIDSDTTLEKALAHLEQCGGAAVVVDKTGKAVGALDLYAVLDFLVFLFKGSLEKRHASVLHEYWNPYFWDPWDRWIETREVVVMTPAAPRVIAEGSIEFFALSVRELMQVPGWDRNTRVSPEPVWPDASLAEVLPALSKRHALLVWKGEGKFQVLGQMDVLRFLKKDMDSVRAFHDKHARDLGVFKHHPHIERTTAPERALLSVMRMNRHNVTALPVVDEEGRLQCELSTGHLRAVHASNFGILMSTVGHLLQASDPSLSVAATAHKRATLGEIVQIMLDKQRTHVWIVKHDKRLAGVVSLVDILAHLSAVVN